MILRLMLDGKHCSDLSAINVISVIALPSLRVSGAYQRRKHRSSPTATGNTQASLDTLAAAAAVAPLTPASHSAVVSQLALSADVIRRSTQTYCSPSLLQQS